jgi:hypothetical protein
MWELDSAPLIPRSWSIATFFLGPLSYYLLAALLMSRVPSKIAVKLSGLTVFMVMVCAAIFIRAGNSAVTDVLGLVYFMSMIVCFLAAIVATIVVLRTLCGVVSLRRSMHLLDTQRSTHHQGYA